MGTGYIHLREREGGKGLQGSESGIETAVFKAVMVKCFEQENPVTAFVSDPVMPLLKVTEKSIDRTQVIRERMIFNFFKGFESMEGVPVDKRNKYCPDSDWMEKVEAARKACVGYVSMLEKSEEKQDEHCVQFENIFDSKKTLKPLEKENNKFSKKACKRALDDMLKALFVVPEGETAFRCLKDNQVESVLAKLNKSKNGESVYAKNAQEFLPLAFRCSLLTSTEPKLSNVSPNSPNRKRKHSSGMLLPFLPPSNNQMTQASFPEGGLYSESVWTFPV